MCKNNNFKKYNAIGYNFKKGTIFIPVSRGVGWMGCGVPMGRVDEPEGWRVDWLDRWTDGWGG